MSAYLAGDFLVDGFEILQYNQIFFFFFLTAVLIEWKKIFW